MRIVNLTQHEASAEQLSADVIEWHSARDSYATYLEETSGDPEDFLTRVPESLKDTLTFNAPTTLHERRERARIVAQWAEEMGISAAMIGGKASFVAMLAEELTKRGILPLEAFTRRETVETRQEDGYIKKTAVFRHTGWDAFLPGWWGSSTMEDPEAYYRIRFTAECLGITES